MNDKQYYEIFVSKWITTSMKNTLKIFIFYTKVYQLFFKEIDDFDCY
jgi:hypothetical protein